VPREATAAWKVYREGMLGRLAVADKGARTGRLDPGKTIKVTSNPVKLDEREIRARHVAGDFEEALAGYVLTITGKDGTVLLEKFSSKEIETAHGASKGERKGRGLFSGWAKPRSAKGTPVKKPGQLPKAGKQRR